MDLPTQQNYENPVRQRAGEWEKSGALRQAHLAKRPCFCEKGMNFPPLPLFYKDFRRIFRTFAAVKNSHCRTQSEWRAAQNAKTMTKKEMNPILELQYRIKRYQAMGNGAMCQDLTMQLQKLQKQGKM